MQCCTALGIGNLVGGFERIGAGNISGGAPLPFVQRRRPSAKRFAGDFFANAKGAAPLFA
jgi:hypothetical protein